MAPFSSLHSVISNKYLFIWVEYYYCRNGANGDCYELRSDEGWGEDYSNDLAGFTEYCSSWQENQELLELNGGPGCCGDINVPCVQAGISATCGMCGLYGDFWMFYFDIKMSKI